MANRIDVMADDKGIAAAFSFSNVNEDMAKAFMAHHRMVTLEDFVYSVTSEKWETELKDLLQQVRETKDNAVALARFRAAYAAGKAALSQAVLPSLKATDMDEPLPDSTMKALNLDWGKRYNFQVEPWLDPSETLKARVYREFKKGQMTVLEMKKVRSVIAMATPRLQESVSLSDGVHLEFAKESTTSLRTAGDYYFQMRILCHAWAWGGNFKVQWEGKQETYIDLGTAMGYADHAFHACLEYGSGSMLWLQRNDVMTRGRMATEIRRGMPAGRALTQALRECYLEWRAPVPTAPAVPHPPSPPKRKAAESHQDEPARRRVKSDAFTTISMVRGGQRICKAYNDERGCKDKACSALHACDVRLSSGKGCLSKSHARLEHPKE